MADARRIIFGTHVVPQEGELAEETIPAKYILLQEDANNNTVAKTLGGKGEVTTSQMQANQWGDSWVSFAHQQMNWEDYADTDDHSGNRWEDMVEAWDGDLTIGGTAVQLSQGNAGATDKDLAFVYVKNTGSNSCYLSCTAGGGSGFNIYIPTGASVHFRGGGTHCDDIYVKTTAGSTTIEYILAKSEA